ncbi:hypothetical protein RchiOBHm_Chr7g0218771 [Rosa chinensis]|uniref:Uncharacterized protein n=1 Tax=Rosa chinensis TaxID=74649 RepID=A0A2P6PCD6_ROSCH|nr:hypothetical protein RchiOBHm_Chr7g0218771 [Rosa chinensis]
MSGISKNVSEELSYERSSDDHMPHIYNIIRYGKDVVKHDLQNCKNWNRFLKSTALSMGNNHEYDMAVKVEKARSMI